ncbi:MAG: signal peptidase I [Planctomycetota bacterium]
MNLFLADDRRHYRRWVNVLPALLIPGGAHFLSGRKIAGIVWLVALLGLSGVMMALLLTPQSSYGIGRFHWLDLVCLAAALGHIAHACRRPIRRIGLKGWAGFLGAFVLIFVGPAVAVRHFYLESFYIPTSAMAPTLIGKEAGGDRILVDKLRYVREPPQRWDVVVFEIDKTRIDCHRAGLTQQATPPEITERLNGTISHPGRARYVNYVKRLVGRPGESIQIKNGDVFIDGRICRKPEAVERALLVPVDGAGAEQPGGESVFDRWAPTNGEAVRAEGDVLHLRGTRAAGGAEVRYRHPIEDRVDADPRTTRRREQMGDFNIVGDLELRLRFRHVAGAGRLVGRLEENGSVYEFDLPLGGREDGARLYRNGREVAQAEPVPTAGACELRFSNIDARVTLWMDGKIVVRYVNDAPGEARLEGVVRVPGHAGQSGASFGAHGCDVDVHAVGLWRDIYYPGDRVRQKFAVGAPFRLGRDEWFVLGDNSPNSFDSRHWGVVKSPRIVGKGIYVFAPADRKKWIE